jgi:cytochrome c-type biogenesis protein CcmH
MKRLLALLLVVQLSAPALAAPIEGTFADPAQEARAIGLQHELRCMVCQGQSIAESDAPLAQDLRRLVREQIAAGKSDGDILEYIHARYGDFVLMMPPVQPYTWLLWLTPLAVLGAGGAVAWVVIAKARKIPDSGEPA